jgi:3-hydroxybutyryl-CoA dehydrogenase
MTTAISNTIRSVGVIGAGQMGNGIAHVCALAGYDVKITDVSSEALERAITTIDHNIARHGARGRVKEEEKQAAMKRIATGTDYTVFDDCDFVIEAATEREEVKREIFK